jgi:hypothetical protein
MGGDAFAGARFRKSYEDLMPTGARKRASPMFVEAQILVWACCEAAMTTLLLWLQLRAAEEQM